MAIRYIASLVLLSITSISLTDPCSREIEYSGVRLSIVNTSNCTQMSIPSGPSQIDHSVDYYLKLNKSQLVEIRHEYEQSSADTHRLERVVYGLGYGLIIVLSLFGNVLVCRVCLRTLTKTNTLIMSLAASDLLMTTCNIPFSYFRYLGYSWPFGDAMCFVVSFVKYLVVYNSSYTMAIIAVQRYCSVCCGLASFQAPSLSRENSASSARRKMSKCQFGKTYPLMRAIYITIAITWTVSACIAAFFTFFSKVVTRKDLFTTMLTIVISWMIDMELKQPSQNHSSLHHNSMQTNQDFPNFDDMDGSLVHFAYHCTNQVPEFVSQFLEQNFSITQPELTQSIVVFVTQYFIPLSVSCLLYIHIGKTISKQGKLVQNTEGNSRARLQQQHKRRRIAMLVLVVAVFAICWLPLHLFHICTDAGMCSYNYQVYMMVHWLAMSSVCYNPFIYCWLNQAFRNSALRVFCCIKREELDLVSTNGMLVKKANSTRLDPVKANSDAPETIQPLNVITETRAIGIVTKGNFLLISDL